MIPQIKLISMGGRILKSIAGADGDSNYQFYFQLDNVPYLWGQIGQTSCCGSSAIHCLRMGYFNKDHLEAVIFNRGGTVVQWTGEQIMYNNNTGAYAYDKTFEKGVEELNIKYAKVLKLHVLDALKTEKTRYITLEILDQDKYIAIRGW